MPSEGGKHEPHVERSTAGETVDARGPAGATPPPAPEATESPANAGGTVDFTPAAGPTRTHVGQDDNREFAVDESAAGSDGSGTAVYVPGDVKGDQTEITDREAARIEKIKIPGYVILSELGHGGMGVVYKARHVQLDRIVALKMVLGGEHASRSFLTRFLQEAKAVAQVQHPNIVQIFEIGEVGGMPYFSLEFVDGGPLDRKTAHKPQTPEFASPLVATLARAMHYAHERHIVHRDLKPANVLLTRDGQPKIADFGLAKKLDDSSQTQAGQVIGTPNYMAPEQARGDVQAIGPHTDQFSLGGILYELLTGRAPFAGATIMETLDQVRNQEPVPPSQLNPATPRDLETICLKCLQKDPAKRYANCGELAEDLGRYQRGEPIKARPVSNVERLVRWGKRNPVVAALSGGVAALLLVATGVSVAFALHFRDAQNTEQQLNTELRSGLEQIRRSNEVFVNVIPEKLQDALYAESTVEEILDYLVEFRNETASRDEQTMQLRAEQAALLRRAQKDLNERKFPAAIDKIKAAQNLAEAVIAAQPRDIDKSRGNLAAILAALGDAHFALRAFDHCRECYEHALQIRQEIAHRPQSGELPAVDRRTDLAAVHARMAETLLKQDLLAESIGHANDAVRELAEFSDKDLRVRGRQARAAARWLLGKAKFLSGDRAQAAEFIDKSFAEFRELVRDNPDQLRLARTFASFLAEYGDLELIVTGNTERARELYDESLALRKELLARDEIIRGQRELSQDHYRRGVAALRLKDPVAAKYHFDACTRLREDAVAGLEEQAAAAKRAKRAPPRLDIIGAKYELMLAQARNGKSDAAADLARRFDKAAAGQPANSPDRAKLLKWAAQGFALSADGMGQPVPPNLAAKQRNYLDAAFVALGQAVAHGYANLSELSTDPDFDPLRSDPRFAALMARIKEKAVAPMVPAPAK